MKTIQEKAKRYDDLLVKLQEAKVDNNVCDERYCCVIDDIVPELKESGDERIRKEIIAFLTYYHTGQGNSVKYDDDWINWLEKQGEQKPVADTKVIIPKFRVGDIVKSKSRPTDSPRKIISIGKDCYWCEDRGCIGFAWEDDCEIVEQKPAAWSEEDEMILSFFVNDLKFIRDTISIDDEYIRGIGSFEGQIGWLKSLKDRVTPQPRQEWSEEDKKYSSYICAALECYYRLREERNNTNGQEELDKARNWLYNRLKFLRPQSQWKPTEEQMEVLLSEVTAWTKGCHKQIVLESLYQDLKKLREE